MKILVIAAHPDDEVLGCGGTLIRHRDQGDEINILIVTVASDPEWSDQYRETKLKEQEKVDELLGIKNRYFLNYPSLELNTVDLGRLNWHIYKVIDDVKPDIIYTHFGHELNEQHNIVSRGTIVGARIPCKADIFMYETPSERFSPTRFSPTYYVVLDRAIIMEKALIFGNYQSEVKKDPHPQGIGAIWNLASYRGSVIGEKYAEAFMEVRRIWHLSKNI